MSKISKSTIFIAIISIILISLILVVKYKTFNITGECNKISEISNGGFIECSADSSIGKSLIGFESDYCTFDMNNPRTNLAGFQFCLYEYLKETKCKEVRITNVDGNPLVDIDKLQFKTECYLTDNPFIVGV